MYQSSEAFGNLVLQDSRTFKALITYDDVSITNAKSIKFTGGAEGEDDFSLGSTVSQYVTITIPNPGKAIEGHELLGPDRNGSERSGRIHPHGVFHAWKTIQK